MSDNEYGVQGLSGPEIIDDLVAQFRKRLAGDCNLRPQDSYSRGYSAKVTYAVTCYGLDASVVEGEFAVGTEQDVPDAEVLDDVLEVAQEEDLGEVRDRIKKDKQEEGQAPDEEETPDPIDATAVRTKRKYTRKVQLASPGVIGGAEEFTE